MSDKKHPIEKQLDTLKENLRLLHESLDEAAEAANVDAVKTLQADIAATEALIASCERRLVKARQQVTEAEKAERRTANLEAVKVVEKEMSAAAGIATELEATLATFIQQLTNMHEHGAKARTAAAALVKQLPQKQQDAYWSLLHAASFTDTSLAAWIEYAFGKAGLFEKLAPHAHVRFNAQGTLGIAGGVGDRATRIPHAFGRLVKQINDTI